MEGERPDTKHDGLLTFKLENEAPVSLEDLTASLAAFSNSYDDYLASSKITPLAGAKLYVQDLRTGSIIAILQAIAKQGHLLWGENGIVPKLQWSFDHADTIASFLENFNDLVNFFLGKPSSKTPTKREAEQLISIFEPVAKDNASQLLVQFNGTVNIGEVHYHYTNEQANALQNSAKRYIGPTIPTNQILHDELLILHQVRGDPKATTGDKGTIESVDARPAKLLFTSEVIKKEITSARENPFQRVFVVDVEVKTIDGKAALYKILAVKDSFDRP